MKTPEFNVEDLTIVRNHLASIGDEQFDYNHVLDESAEEAFYKHKVYHFCGTVGCVAGWVCVLFNLYPTLVESAMYVAAKHLWLNKSDEIFLFTRRCDIAQRVDAIRRIDYLLEHGTSEGYDFSGETQKRYTGEFATTTE